jgi:small subunit ribosomal protein S21
VYAAGARGCVCGRRNEPVFRNIFHPGENEEPCGGKPGNCVGKMCFDSSRRQRNSWAATDYARDMGHISCTQTWGNSQVYLVFVPELKYDGCSLSGRFGGVNSLAEVRVQEGEPLENALRRFKRKVQQEDIIKEVKRHSYYLKPGEKRRVKAALARKRNRKKARKEQD